MYAIRRATQPLMNQTCSAAEDAARFTKFGYNENNAWSRNAGWLLFR
jgi:hypothetical protein